MADFSSPQRQSPIGVLVMFFYTLQQSMRALWPIVVVWIVNFEKINKLQLFAGAAVVLIGLAIVSYLKYRNFTFYLDEVNDEFVLTDGIFNKSKTTIQLQKIQQVNINQSFIQKLVRVYALEVDTAGSTKKEGSIKAISHELALELKARLLENEKKTPVFSETDQEPEVGNSVSGAHPFIKISLLTLIKVGITSNYLRSFGLLLLFYSTIQENLRNFTDEDVIDGEQIDQFFTEERILTGILIVFVLLFLIVLVINLVRIIFKFYDYKITKQKGSLLLSFGLLNTKNTIIKPEKVQITTITRNFFQKKMDILEIKIKQATSDEVQQKKAVIEIPGCSAVEKDAILQLLFKKIPEKGVMLKPNFRKLVFSIFTTIILPLCVYFALGYWIDNIVFEFIYLVPVYIVFLGLVVLFYFRNNRLFINDDFIIRQSGAWDVDNQIIEIAKIQAISTSQLFWHKKADIGSITLHTAGGDLSFDLGDYAKLKHYVNLWLYEIETTDVNWM